MIILCGISCLFSLFLIFLSINCKINTNEIYFIQDSTKLLPSSAPSPALLVRLLLRGLFGGVLVAPPRGCLGCWGRGSMPNTLWIWRKAMSRKACWALAVMSSLSWLVRVAASSVGSFSQGSNNPESCRPCWFTTSYPCCNTHLSGYHSFIKRVILAFFLWLKNKILDPWLSVIKCYQTKVRMIYITSKFMSLPPITQIV